QGKKEGRLVITAERERLGVSRRAERGKNDHPGGGHRLVSRKIATEKEKLQELKKLGFKRCLVGLFPALWGGNGPAWTVDGEGRLWRCQAWPENQGPRCRHGVGSGSGFRPRVLVDGV